MIPRDPDELVQVILVSEAGTHEDTVRAVANASVMAWLNSPEDPAWEVWLSQPFAKSVRRIKPSKIGTLSVPSRGLYAIRDSMAIAYAPMPMDQFPAPLAKAQVQGTDFPRMGWEAHGATEASPVLVLNPAVADVMSTGKTAAQAAHALMAYLLTVPAEERVIPWPLHIRVAENVTEFEDVCQDAVVVIRDHGRTEIKPDTATFAVV